jgi:hypothetical protein
MKNIELLGLQNTLQLEPIIRLLDHKTYLTNEQIDEVLALGEAGLREMRLILKAYINKVKVVKESDGDLCFLAHIADFFTELRDEAVLEDVITIFRVDFELAEWAMSDGITEYIPEYFALFPHRIDTYKKYIFDATLDLNTKNIILNGLTRAINLSEIKAQPEPILALMEDYLRFLQIPANRIAHNTRANVKYSYQTEEFISFLLIDYDEAGGDRKSDFIKYFFDNNLIDKTIVGDYKEFTSFGSSTYPTSISSIYEKNEIWREAVIRENKTQNSSKKINSPESATLLNNLLSQSFSSYERNDKVNVRYNDGKILKDVKFKKVEDDLQKGLCQIID